MPRPHWTTPEARESTERMLSHPSITDTRTLAECLHVTDHPELYADTPDYGPPVHTPSDQAKYRESAYLTVSKEDTVTVHFRHTGIW